VWLWRALAVALSLAGALWMVRGALPQLSRRYVGLTDTHWVEGVTWWYWNISASLFRGINPLHNDLHGYPVGIDHIRLMGNFADAGLCAPYFWIFAPPLNYNLTAITFAVFNFLAAWWMFERWSRSRVVAACLSFALGFHPLFLFFLEEGRPTQFIFGFVYLGIGGLAPLLRDPHAAGTRALTIGAIGAYLCFWFNGLFVHVVALLALIARTPGLDPQARRVMWRKALISFGISVGACIPFGLPVLLDVLVGAGIRNVQLFEAPPPLHFSWFTARPWEPLLAEPRFHMFLPWASLALLVVFLGALLVRRLRQGWGDRAVWGLLASILVFYLLILGPYLHLGDEPYTTVSGSLIMLPWAWLYSYLPFFSRLTYPYLVFPFLIITVFIAVGLLLGRLREASNAPLRWVAVALALALPVEILARGGGSVPCGDFTVPSFYAEIRHDDRVGAMVEYPFGSMDFRQVYQFWHRRPLVNVRGHENMNFESEPGMLELVESTPFLSGLRRWQLEGGAFPDLSRADKQQMVELGVTHLVVSEQAYRKSSKFPRALSFDELLAQLGRGLGTPVHADPDAGAYLFAISGSSGP